MRCENCGQTDRMTLLVELSVQISADGTRQLPDWALTVQCPDCQSTDVNADPDRLLKEAIANAES